jgi:hypothetical protein
VKISPWFILGSALLNLGAAIALLRERQWYAAWYFLAACQINAALLMMTL